MVPEKRDWSSEMQSSKFKVKNGKVRDPFSLHFSLCDRRQSGKD